MRWLTLLFSLWLGLVHPCAMAQTATPQAGTPPIHGSVAQADPTGDIASGTWVVEVAIWSTIGAPTVTATIMGEPVVQELQLFSVGEYRGRFLVPPGRLLPVDIRVGNQRRYDDLIILHYGDQRHSWVVKDDGVVERSSSPVSVDSMAIQEALILLAGAFWILIVSIGLVGGRLERGGKALSWRLPEVVWLALWIGAAVSFTWPAIFSSDTMIVGRHFDTFGTMWVVGAGSRLIAAVDPLTAWPMGGDLSRLDSYVLVPIAVAFKSLGAGRIFGWIGIIGVALNAWSAQHFSRAVGAKSPWTLLAGFGYGFCGLAATSMLEGHVYQLFNPWLPWFGATMWLATKPDGKWYQAWLAGLLFGLCWATTAYVGLTALGLAVGVLLVSDRRPKELLLCIAVILFLYISWYMYGQAPSRESLEPLNPMSAQFSGMLAATPEMDRSQHSMAPIVFGWMLGLVVLAHKVVPKGRWRVLVWCSVAAMLFSLFPQFAASPDLILIPANLDWVKGPFAGMLRFPIRWGWLWALCGGVVAARVATEMAPRWGRWGYLVLAVVVAEAFLRVGTPYRQEFRYIDSPSKLTNHDGPILELFPFTENKGLNHQRWLSSISCLEQLKHGQALAEDCVHTKPYQMRQHLNLWVQDLLNRGHPESIEPTLAGLGFRNIMLRPDLFITQDASKFEGMLRAVDDNPTVIREKGVHALLFTIVGSAEADPKEMLKDIRPPERPEVARRDWLSSSHHGRYNGIVALISWALIAFCLIVVVRRR